MVILMGISINSQPIGNLGDFTTFGLAVRDNKNTGAFCPGKVSNDAIAMLGGPFCGAGTATPF